MGERSIRVVLIGHRRAGKTTVGRALAQRLGVPFRDLDEEVQRRTGRTPARWLADEGEPAFRAIEARTLDALAHVRGAGVLATGGGTPFHGVARSELEAAGIVLWLRVRRDGLLARVRPDDGRPLLHGATPTEELDAHFEERERGYARMAQRVIDADGSVSVVVDRCLAALRELGCD